MGPLWNYLWHCHMSYIACPEFGSKVCLTTKPAVAGLVFALTNKMIRRRVLFPLSILFDQMKHQISKEMQNQQFESVFHSGQSNFTPEEEFPANFLWKRSCCCWLDCFWPDTSWLMFLQSSTNNQTNCSSMQEEVHFSRLSRFKNYHSNMTTKSQLQNRMDCALLL